MFYESDIDDDATEDQKAEKVLKRAQQKKLYRQIEDGIISKDHLNWIQKGIDENYPKFLEGMARLKANGKEDDDDDEFDIESESDEKENEDDDDDDDDDDDENNKSSSRAIEKVKEEG